MNMALYIKDPTVDDLAARVQKLSGAKSKTEAVRRSLEKEESQLIRQQSLQGRMAEVWTLAESMGPSDPNVDMKAFMDDLSGEVDE
jgi:antitoxin VapB